LPLNKSALWFIPTHVGNSPFSSRASAVSMVHPHACGELGRAQPAGAITRGSSPRMWGTHLLQSPFSKRGGFIPTHVGNSSAISISTPDIAVHPHACGELLTTQPQIDLRCGSSPRMWGTRYNTGNVSSATRFIPTHVGNSTTPRFSHSGTMVHPHACGELNNLVGSTIDRYGSSPRMWGTHVIGERTRRRSFGSSPRMWGTQRMEGREI